MDLAARAMGCLVGMAYGDALGVPYEAGCRPLPAMGAAGLFGGGLGGYEPGEWSDDTQMAICVAQAAEDEDLTTEAGLDAVAARFEAWYAAGPADIGIQTAQVLRDAAARSGAPASRLRGAASAFHTRTGRSAGNGALMRTAPVSLALVGDPDAITAAARAIAELTHADPVAGDACVLWSLTIDSCLRVTTSRPTPSNHLDALPPERRDSWASWIAAADHEPPGRFADNGYTVTALQAAWAACRLLNPRNGFGSFARTVPGAVGAGGDTDTVAAIAGALAGALHSHTALPEDHNVLHGWPGINAADLASLAQQLVEGARRRR
jgi:ADP-ribosyl-[dinitrogen reductase] hydrolase